MNRSRWTLAAAFAAAAFAASLGACDSNTVQPSLVSDAEITADVAKTSGDAMATAVSTMTANEADAGLSGAQQPPGSNLTDGTVSYTKTRHCYDANGDLVVGCSPISSVRKVVTFVRLDGNRARADDDGETWTGAVHRVSNDTVLRVFANTTETQRVHTDIALAHDTTTFSDTGAAKSRFVAEAALDSINGVTFDLPRATNPFPVAGSIIRTDSVHAIVTKGTTTTDRQSVRRVEIDFPADAQGNVTLKINAKVCNLNLVTHAVTNCH